MKTVRLTSSDRDLYQRGDLGELGERLAEENYSGYSSFRASNFDLANETGSVVEVKSCQSVLDNGEAGRFRLFKTQHEQLVSQDRDGSAFYVFVVIDVEGRQLGPARLKRMNPADVGNMIGARGGWYNAGHNSGEEYKLPITAVF